MWNCSLLRGAINLILPLGLYVAPQGAAPSAEAERPSGATGRRPLSSALADKPEG